MRTNSCWALTSRCRPKVRIKLAVPHLLPLQFTVMETMIQAELIAGLYNCVEHGMASKVKKDKAAKQRAQKKLMKKKIRLQKRSRFQSKR